MEGLRNRVIGVVGDFDSIADEDGAGVMRVPMPSQEANDMFKCLAVLKGATDACSKAAATGGKADLSARSLAAAAMRCLGLEAEHDAVAAAASADRPAAPGKECFEALRQGKDSFDVVVLGGLGGRFDHEAQSLNALVVW